MMLKRMLAVAWAAALAGASAPAFAEDLLQIYREALANDPVLASARANWEATQEAVPQARAGLLPSVTLVGNATIEVYHNDRAVFSEPYPLGAMP